MANTLTKADLKRIDDAIEQVKNYTDAKGIILFPGPDAKATPAVTPATPEIAEVTLYVTLATIKAYRMYRSHLVGPLTVEDIAEIKARFANEEVTLDELIKARDLISKDLEA